MRLLFFAFVYKENHRLCLWDKKGYAYAEKKKAKEVQEKTTEVLSQFPTLIKMRSTGNSNADPFLIATAALQGGTVVTDERLGDVKTLDLKIPNVCQALDIPYMNLRSFLDTILE